MKMHLWREEAAEAPLQLQCQVGVGQRWVHHGVRAPICTWELWVQRALCRKWGAPHTLSWGSACLPMAHLLLALTILTCLLCTCWEGALTPAG